MRLKPARMSGIWLLVATLVGLWAVAFSFTQKIQQPVTAQSKASATAFPVMIHRTGCFAMLGVDDVSVPPAPQLIVLLPAFNEVERIDETLDSYCSYLNGSSEWKNMTNILVVDDGSDDGTAGYVRGWKQEGSSVGVTCISLPRNRGKGAAVSIGVSHLVDTFGNKPCLVLIADADGSGNISCLDHMVTALGSLIATLQARRQSDSFWNTPAIINGYRGYDRSSLSRSVLRWGFRTTVRILCGDLQVRDTQCGFKLMTLSAARQLYDSLNLKRWSHDVEVLYRARECDMPVAEVVVPWQEKDGSKLVQSSAGTIQASAVMFLEVLRMRLEYIFGRWKLPMIDDKDR